MPDFISFSPSDLSVAELHKYLLSAVAPRPIALASTIDLQGCVNLSPFSFFNVFSSNPPVVVFSPARRSRDSTTKHTYQNVLEVKEVVINIVNYAIVEQTSLSSTEYGKGVNEFDKAGFTMLTSDLVSPPRVAQSPVSMECKVDDIIVLGKEGGAGHLIIAQVVRMHIDEQYLDREGQLDTTKLDLVGRMGGHWYTRVTKDALFEIPKPLSAKGIGIDSLPEHIRNSPILTGNELARLGNLKELPKLRKPTNSKMNPDQLHREAQKLIRENKSLEALELLLSKV